MAKLNSSNACKKLVAILLIIILLTSFIARLVTTDFGKIKVEQVTIDARGAALNCELSYPANTTDKDKYPAVLVTHGGGCTYETVKGIAQEFARRGFVVLNVSGYGSGTSDQPVYDEGGSGPEAFDLNSPAGMLDGVNFLRTLKFVDQTRIGVTGHSTGSKRVGTTSVMDCGFLNFNDIMITVLVESFGQSFTAEEINQDADKLAKDRLNDDQLAHYNTIREAKWEHYNTRIKGAVLFGSEGAMIVPSQTVEVAGHQVVRNAQTNMAIVNGTYDFSYYNLPRRDLTKASWYTGAEDVVLETWYAIDDTTGTSEMLGELTKTSVADNEALSKAVDKRSVRMIVNNDETHSKNFLSLQTAADIVKVMEQMLGYNCGYLSDSSTVPMDVNKQTWHIRNAMNCIAMLAMIALMFPLLYLLLTKKFFEDCVVEVKKAEASGLGKGAYAAISVFIVALGAFAIYKANKGGIFAYDPGPFLSLTRTACLTIEFMKWICIGAAVVVVFAAAVSKKNTGKFGLEKLNIAINIKKILKSVLVAFILLVAAYSTVSIVDYFFNEQFRFWMTAFARMKADYWIIAFRYVLVFFPMYLLVGAAVNITKRDDIPEWKDTLYTVIINSLGVWLLCLFNICRAWFAYDGTLFSNFACSYQLLFTVPMTIYISRKFYNKTGSIWTGAAFNAFIVCWSMTANLGIHDMYVGQSLASIILGV